MCARQARTATSPWNSRSTAPPDSAGFPTGRSSCLPFSRQKVYHADPQGNLLVTHDLSHLAWSTNDLLVAPEPPDELSPPLDEPELDEPVLDVGLEPLELLEPERDEALHEGALQLRIPFPLPSVSLIEIRPVP